MNNRRTAAFIVMRWIETKEYPQEMLPKGGPDRAFVQDLVYTTIRRFRPLRGTLGKLVTRWPKGELEALLLVGAAQILYMPDVPDFAAVNETVEAAKLAPNPNIARVVNGTLRNLLRRRAEFEAALAAAPLAERESFPNALVKRWVARYGADAAARLCAWHNEPAETFLAQRDGTFAKLERGARVTDVAGYAEGDFIVQDPATAIAVRLAEVKPGMTALDFCAAPGGKAIQMAWRGASVTAQEVNPRRRARLVENVVRCGLAGDGAGKVRVVADAAAERVLADATQDGLYDVVLVDAPCSNTGVLRRRPDARWRWTEERLGEIAALQAEILEKAAAFCRPGGRLVYSTCSNEPEENGARVAAFLAARPAFREAAREEAIPFSSGTDGAFACAFLRATSSFVV